MAVNISSFFDERVEDDRRSHESSLSPFVTVYHFDVRLANIQLYINMVDAIYKCNYVKISKRYYNVL